MREPRVLQRQRGLPGMASAAVQALRRLCDYLVPRPESYGEEAGAMAQDRVGALIERLKGWNQATPTDTDKGDREQLGWQLAGQVGARIVPRQRRARNMQGFGKNLDNSVN